MSICTNLRLRLSYKMLVAAFACLLLCWMYVRAVCPIVICVKTSLAIIGVNENYKAADEEFSPNCQRNARPPCNWWVPGRWAVLGDRWFRNKASWNNFPSGLLFILCYSDIFTVLCSFAVSKFHFCLFGVKWFVFGEYWLCCDVSCEIYVCRYWCIIFWLGFLIRLIVFCCVLVRKVIVCHHNYHLRKWLEVSFMLLFSTWVELKYSQNNNTDDCRTSSSFGSSFPWYILLESSRFFVLKSEGFINIIKKAV